MTSRNKRRMSIHGGALRDTSSRSNRRGSIAPGAFASTPDRRDRLENHRFDQSSRREIARNEEVFGRIGVSSAVHRTDTSTSQLSGLSALERYRLQKQQKLQQQERNTVTMHTPTNTLVFNEDLSRNVATLSSRHSPTPRNFTNNVNTSAASLSTLNRENIDPTPKKKLGGRSLVCQDNTIGDVETNARYEEMQRRLQKLQEEKIDITIAMAPMEARHRQKEEAWQKEEIRLLQEVEAMKVEVQNANERVQDMKAQYEAKEQEIRQLRNQIRKESSSVRITNNEMERENSDHRQIQEELHELKQKYQNALDDIQASRLSRVSVEKELHATKMELESLAKVYEELQNEHDEVSRLTSIDQEAQIKLDVLTEEHIATSAQLNAVRSDLAAFTAAFAVQEEEMKASHDLEIEKYQFELSVLKTRCAEGVKKSETSNDVEDYAVLKAHIEERDRKIAEFENERMAWETLRRHMHNRIQELSGNIRVFVRTRPFLPNDGNSTKSAIDVSLDGESLSIVDGRTGSPFDFKFDKVFAPSAGQDNIFEEVADFVQSALDGYNVCLFSYGQTGSGKTHTMQGSGNGAMRGIIPRAVEQILQQSQKMESHGWSFSLAASFLEIYNEDLKDLLVSMSDIPTKNKPKLAIKRSREGKSFVENLTEIPIETANSVVGMNQLEKLMKSAARSRSVASTKMNAQSSRSHSVFMLHLRGFNEDKGVEVRGALNLCDLAGSERLDRSGAGTDSTRLRETQAINKSLSCLGDVFTALAQKSSHIPFRNSKLTYLLQDCLSGDGKALMFVNLSPTCESSNESLCSLRFAQRVNQVELGKAKKQVCYNKR